MTAYNKIPGVDDSLNFPLELLLQMSRVGPLKYLVVPMTQAQRDNLTESDLWHGRTIYNLTADVLQAWNGVLWQSYTIS